MTMLDMPRDMIAKIFTLAGMTDNEENISGIVRFISPEFGRLFKDSRTTRVSEISNKGPELVKWAHRQGLFQKLQCSESRVPMEVSLITTPELIRWYMDTFRHDALPGHLFITTTEILEWALAEECWFMFRLGRQGLSDWDFGYAAEEGRLDIVKWRYQNNVGFDSSARYRLVGNANAGYMTTYICNRAAEGGQLHVLKWARSMDPPCAWGYDTTQAAARGGHLDVLVWLRQHQCPWNKYTIDAAARSGHHAVVEWARENGCPQ